MTEFKPLQLTNTSDGRLPASNVYALYEGGKIIAIFSIENGRLTLVWCRK